MNHHQILVTSLSVMIFIFGQPVWAAEDLHPISAVIFSKSTVEFTSYNTTVVEHMTLTIDGKRIHECYYYEEEYSQTIECVDQWPLILDNPMLSGKKHYKEFVDIVYTYKVSKKDTLYHTEISASLSEANLNTDTALDPHPLSVTEAAIRLTDVISVELTYEPSQKAAKPKVDLPLKFLLWEQQPL